MSFALSGSVITQSGSDSDLSGLSGNGATVTDFGAYKVYNCGANRLVVTGTLSINALDGVQEQLLVGTGDQSVVDLEISGSLTVGLDSSNSDGSYIDTIHFPSVVEKDIGLNFGTSRGKNDSWAGSQSPFMLVKAGGTLIWNGNMVMCGGIGFDGDGNGATDSTIVLNNAVWDTRTVAEYGSFDQLIYSYTRDINISGLTVIATNIKTIANMFTQLATPLYPIKNYIGVFTGAAFSGSTSQPVGFTLVIEDYTGIIGNSTADDIQPQGRTDADNGDVTFLNSSKGSNLQIGTNQTDSIKLIKSEQNIQGEFVNGSGTAINDFIIGTVDINSTLYSAVGSNGLYDMGNLLLAKWDGGVGVGTLTKTEYSPNANGDDLYDFYMYSYLYQNRNRLQVELRTTGGMKLNFIGSSDDKISEVDKSIVDAYTVLSDMNMLYDYSKSYKVSNILLPSINTPNILAQGSTLDLGNLDMRLTLSGAAYSCTSSLITVRIK